MSKIGIIAQRELLENARTKTFWIGILSVPILVVLSVAGQFVLAKLKAPRQYAVVDQSGWLLQSIDDRARYEDVRQLLLLVQEKARRGGTALQQLPTQMQSLAAMVKDASETQIVAMARAIASASASAPSAEILEQLPPEAREQVAAEATAMVAWLATLSPEDAKRIKPGLSGAKYIRKEIPPGEADPESWLRGELEKGRENLFAYFVIGTDPVTGSMGSRYVSNSRTDNELLQWFSRLGSDVVKERRFEAEGIDRDIAKRIQDPLIFEEKQIGEGGKEAKVTAVDRVRQWAPVLFVYMLWLTIFISTALLLNNTVEEKSNKTIEVLLSSASAVQIMVGKTLGIAATGFIVVVSWIATVIVGILIAPAIFGGKFSLDFGAILADPLLLGSFVVYFVLGFLLYAAALVALGSVCNSVKEAQNLMQPVSIVLMIPLIAMVPIGQDPNGMLAKVLSFIPPFTPFVMMNRAAGPPAAWEYAATTLLMIVSIVVAFYMAAKVFRIGVLMTGKPPGLSEIVRWIKAPVGSTPVGKRE